MRFWLIIAVMVAVYGAVPLSNRCAIAQPPAIKDDAELKLLHTVVSRFFDGISSSDGGQRRAFEELLTGSPLANGNNEKNKKLLDELVLKTADIEKKFGKYQAHELHSITRIGKDVVQMKYLYKCANFPVVWHFTFYRNQQESTKWFVITIRFDTRIESLGK